MIEGINPVVIGPFISLVLLVYIFLINHLFSDLDNYNEKLDMCILALINAENYESNNLLTKKGCTNVRKAFILLRIAIQMDLYKEKYFFSL